MVTFRAHNWPIDYIWNVINPSPSGTIMVTILLLAAKAEAACSFYFGWLGSWFWMLGLFTGFAACCWSVMTGRMGFAGASHQTDGVDGGCREKTKME